MTVAWSTTFLSKMKDTVPDEFDPEGLAPGIAAHSNIGVRFYHDVQVNVKAGNEDQFEFFVGVSNVFDRKPPQLEDTVFYGNITGTETAADVYDPFGRRFYAGAQVHF
ncbi:TonB-dependent receptor [Sphingosinicellaceae bacterium]|nr:TonB-dependent receptor [Sphingosinicellaceae bacterium]